MIDLYSGVKEDIDIKKAKEREYNKAVKYILNPNYILHFKMIFEKEKIKLNISEENYLNTEKVPNNVVTKRIREKYDGSSNIYADWGKFDAEEKWAKLVELMDYYPDWVRYDWINGELHYNKEYIRRKKKKALENYRLNMEFYKKLNQDEFNKCLNRILKLKNNQDLKEVLDLKEFLGIKGIYVMVLDKYKQIYVGQSQRDVVARIIQHWTKNIELENLKTGDKEKLRMDSFGLLDTTRIFIEEVEVSNIDKREEEIVKQIPEEYLMNIVDGGIKLDCLSSCLKYSNSFKHRKLK